MGNKSNKKRKLDKQKITYYTSRAYYASPKNLSARIPELRTLHNKTIAVFGLGCLGAHSVLELVRANVGFFRLVDYDIVDPATTIRWPIGFTASGEKKVYALSRFICANYPYTQCDAYDFKVGGIRNLKKSLPMQQKVIEEITNGADLIFDCTAEWGVQNFLADYAWNCKIPYISLSGTWGAWGGRVIRFRPWRKTGCYSCYRLACYKGDIPKPPSAPDDQGSVQPIGCADPTFTGTGFDMLQVSLMGVRMAVATLCEGVTEAYPCFDSDIVHIRLRDDNGALIAPKYDLYNNEPNSDCPRCHGKTK